MESELGKSGLGLMPPVPTPQFQCPGLRRKPRASWSRTFRGGGAAGALGLGFLDPLSRKRHLRWGQVREGSLPEGSTLEQEGTGTGRSLRRRPAGAGAGRRGGARGGGDRGQGVRRRAGRVPTWPVGSGSLAVSSAACPRPPPARKRDPPPARPVPALRALRLRQDRAARSRPLPRPRAIPSTAGRGRAGPEGGGRLLADPRGGSPVPARPHPAARPAGTWARRPPGPPPARSSLGVDAPGSLFQAPRERGASCPDDLGVRPSAPRLQGRGSRGATREAGIEGPGSQEFESWRKPSLSTGAVGRGPSTPPSLADPAALVLM